MPQNTRVKHAAINHYSPSIQPTWSFQAILSALRQHMSGNLSKTAQMVRSMEEDDEIPSSLDKLTNSVLKSPFGFETYEDEALKETLDEVGCEMLPDTELYNFISWKVMLGASIGVLDWVKTPELWYPKIRFLDPEFQFYDPDRKCWFYNAKEGLLEVTPGDGVWFLHTDGEYGYHKGKVRSLSKNWYQKQLCLRDWNRYNERHGLPIIKAKVPVGTHENEKEQFTDDIHNMGAEGVVGLWQDTDEWNSYDIDLLETKDQAWATFQKFLERNDRKAKMTLLGGNLSEVDSEGANKAASQTHAIELDRKLVKAIAQRLSEDLKKQVMTHFMRLNYGDAKRIPYPCWTTDPPEDKNQKATAISSVATALSTFSTAGYTVENLDEVAAQYGLELSFTKPPEPKAPAGSKAYGLALASGEKSDAAIEGVIKTERLADDIGKEASGIIRPDVKTLSRMVREATSYPDLENRIRVAFSATDPNELADLLSQAMLVSTLGGRTAVAKEAEE